MDQRNRHLALVAGSAGGTAESEPVASRRADTEGDRVGARPNLALGFGRRDTPFADYPWGSWDPFGRLSQVGRAAMEQAPAGGVQAGAQADCSHAGGGRWDRARGALALYSQGRGRVELGHRQRLLRRAADDVAVGSRRVLRLPRGSSLALRADAKSRARLRRIPLLDRMARTTVAKYIAALSAVRGVKQP